MNRISFGQFAAMLLITDTFTLFCLMGNVSAVTACGFLSGTVLQLLISLPAAFFYKNCGKMLKPVMWFYLAYILCFGGILFVMLWNTSEALSIPADNFRFIPEKLLISGLIAVVCLYASSPGVKALSRAAVIAAALGAVCLIIMLCGSASRWSVGNLINLSHADGFFSQLFRGFLLSGGLGSFIVLLGYTKGSPVKYSIGYFIGKMVLFTVIPLTTAAVAGGIMKISDFPAIMAAELSQPFSSQRIDSLFLIIFVIMAVFAIAVQAVCVSFLISEIFPSFRKFRSTFSLAVMIGIAFPLAGFAEYWSAFAAVTAISPLVILLCKRRKC